MAGTVPFSFADFHEDEIAILGRFGDREAVAYLWEAATAQVARITHQFARKYSWIDHDDLSQSVLAEFPKMIRRYNPEKAHSWNKFLYFAIYRAAQDALRKEDPVGIGIPQKKPYPAWRRFSDLADDPYRLEAVILDGFENLDNERVANLDPVPLPSRDVHPDHLGAR